MTLIQLATHTQSQLDQAVERIGTLAAEHTAEIQAKNTAHAAALAARDTELATVRQQYTELSAYKAAMEAQVSAVLQSGDPAQYEALAADFLTPAEEKARLAKLARIEALKGEAAALEATI